jgi:multisubunit Na+/H+ antiporter MnhB subunit
MISSRSPVVRTAIHAASPLALVVATYLFFAGHNQPGGGFAAGLVLGAVIALRTVVGLQQPMRAIALLGAGAIIAALVAMAPMLAGDVLLDQAIADFKVPVLGKVKVGTSLLFDAGVTLIVVGLVVAVLEGLGASQLAESPDKPEAAHVGEGRR